MNGVVFSNGTNPSEFLFSIPQTDIALEALTSIFYKRHAQLKRYLSYKKPGTGVMCWNL